MTRRQRTNLAFPLLLGPILLLSCDAVPAAVTRYREGPRLRQAIPAMDLNNVPAQTAITEIMRRAQDPLPVLLCRCWASVPVNVHVAEPDRLDHVLQSLADKLGATITWYISFDPGSVGRANPYFMCPPDDPGPLLVMNRDGTWSSPGERPSNNALQRTKPAQALELRH